MMDVYTVKPGPGIQENILFFCSSLLWNACTLFSHIKKSSLLRYHYSTTLNKKMLKSVSFVYLLNCGATAQTFHDLLSQMIPNSWTQHGCQRWERRDFKICLFQILIIKHLCAKQKKNPWLRHCLGVGINIHQPQCAKHTQGNRFTHCCRDWYDEQNVVSMNKIFCYHPLFPVQNKIIQCYDNVIFIYL